MSFLVTPFLRSHASRESSCGGLRVGDPTGAGEFIAQQPLGQGVSCC